MSWRIEYLEEAKKNLKKLDRSAQIIVISARADEQVYIEATKKTYIPDHYCSISFRISLCQVYSNIVFHLVFLIPQNSPTLNPKEFCCLQ